MDDEEFDFEKIEEERKIKMNKLYGEIIRQRATYNVEDTVVIDTPSGLEEAIQNYVEPDTKVIGDVNIPLSDFYLKNFIFQVEYLEIENAIRLEKSTQTNENILKIKIEINKRLNQINNDPQKVEIIADILKKYSQSYVFVEIFTCKFLEQCTVQVSRSLESYRQFAYLFKMVYSNDLFCFYKANLIKKMSGLRGMYATYFGVLVELNLLDELWAFGAGLLNTELSNDSFVVLEVFLMIGGPYMSHKISLHYKKLLRYIKRYTLRKIKEPALKFRIEELLH